MQQQLLFGKKPPTSQNEKIVLESKERGKLSVNQPWVEKYRPNRVEEISFQEEVVQSTKGILLTGNLPNTLLYGPPGTGKTSTILALAKQLFGPTFYRQRVLELNASDDRGIGVVREKVKKFAQSKAARNPDKNFLCPNYKIIILDEADSMTTDAQSALRRIIEDNSSNTRFCIICNYITKIIEPLASRCVKYAFKPISIEAQFAKLKYICDNEGLSYDEMALMRLINVSGGDLRRSTNLLQSASILYGKRITEREILEMSGIIPEEKIKNLMKLMFEADLDNLLKEAEDVLLEGYSPDQISEQYFDLILSNKEISELKKARIIEKIALCDKALNEGAKEDLQIFELFSSSLSILSKPDF